MTLDEAEAAVLKAVNDYLAVVAEDHQVTEEEYRRLEQLEQTISDKITTVLADHGYEIGDERTD